MAKGDRRRKKLDELGPLSEANEALIEAWVGYLRTRRLSRNTVSAYALDLEQLARSYDHGGRDGISLGEGRTVLTDISGAGLQGWLVDMSDGDGDEPEWAPSTINRKLAAIRQFYKWVIVLRGMEIPNPALHLENARTSRGLPKFLEAADLRRIFDLLLDRADGRPDALPVDCKDPAEESLLALIDYLVAGMCYYWGLRISEATGLSMDDLRIEESGDVTVIARRKGGEIRVFPSQPQIAPQMHRYLALRPSIEVAAPGHRDRFLLYPPTGRGLTRQTAFRRLREAATTALGEKGRHVSPHWFRHSLARHLLDERWDPEDVREALQHRRLETTAIYLKGRGGEVQRKLQRRDLEDAERERLRQVEGGDTD